MVRILFLTGILIFAQGIARAQEVFFFTEGTDNTFYDQGVVSKDNLGESTFEFTHPPGAPQYNDKVPCSTTAYKGSTSLKFNYISAEDGNWRATIYRSDWSTADISCLDSLAFYLFYETELPASALPLIGFRAVNKNGSGDVNSQLFSLADYNENIPVGEWTKVKFPLSVLFNDSESADLDFTKVKGIIFNQSESNGTSRLILIDEISAYKKISEIPAVENLVATGYDSHAELNWDFPMEDLAYRIYASFDGGANYEQRAETTENYYLDFVSEQERNSEVLYRVVSTFQENESEPAETSVQIRDFSDDELMDMVQRYSFRYFWEGAHQATGMALERSNGNGSTAASGATGMGLMAMIVAHEREYKQQEEIKDRILNILEFLENCERHHGAWSHWYNADTYETQPFSTDDDGGDLVETSFVAQGLIALKNYFTDADAKSVQIRETADELWRGIDWDWYRNGQNVLFWHWSPNINFQKNMKVTGWNECLVTYVMAASSPTHGVSKVVYDQGWAGNGAMVNPRTFYDHEIRLSPDWGGPLFWIHYSHLGINPHGLSDKYANYWQEHVNTAKIHHTYAIDNPKDHANYSDKNWGLTASDDPYGYTAHQPVHNDNGTISPTAALGSMPYTPEESMKALNYFYRERGKELFGKFGPYDAFNDNLGWVQEAYIGIDQGPIVVMLENHRTGLLWNTVMEDADVQAGLDKLGFQYQVSSSSEIQEIKADLKIYPNPAGDYFFINSNPSFQNKKITIRMTDLGGKLVLTKEIASSPADFKVDCSGIDSGFYIVELSDGEFIFNTKLLIQNKLK
ncbi:glucoamylase family protein [Mariniphaga sp.]|uniref:glucoamylase family protein n=1 Tax=Mariniphaga sp. TaxID=1954475 RepID=UPI003568E888